MKIFQRTKTIHPLRQAAPATRWGAGQPGNILRAGVFALLAAALLTGCAKEPAPEPNGDTPPAGGTVTAEVTLTPEFVRQIDVKSVDGTDENVIKDVWVIQLNSGGTAQLQDPQYLSSVTPLNGTYKIAALFIAADSKVYFLANTHNSSLCTASNAATTAQVEALTLAVTGESDLASTNGVPMAGQWSGTPDQISGIRGSVSLSRAIAKVTFNLSASLPSGESFTLKSVKVKKVPKAVQYFRSDLSATPYPATTVAWFDDYASATYDEALGSTVKTLWWYLPENARGTGSATLPEHKTAAKAPSGQGGYCTYIEVAGIYKETKNPLAEANTTYRIFLGANHTDDYNLRRNTAYAVTTTIKGVNLADTRIDADWTYYLDYTDNLTPWFWIANDDAGQMRWDAATTACPAGWRLPTQQELMLMWVYKAGVGNLTGANYWSGTEASSRAWSVTMSNGITDTNIKSTSSYSVRCVRDL